ncbi:hypothetical protein K1718_02535 [Roseibium porphyridii]|uniref:Surface antigen domain-containing protein n=1 Tax=Roseibium porphyridii TaxID=2866279 RepID=A0ABY8FAG4_9HYPH|nr:hypothetical protein [Roseibium sp. KMA01]WFE90245.1 hypothetical protein K1718_02535 [Roseibium sp. KMA01]
MTLEEKREQIALVEKIGKILDREIGDQDRAELLSDIRQSPKGNELLRLMSQDDFVLQSAMPAAIPDESMDRFQGLIDREFEKRGVGSTPRRFPAWTGSLVQVAAALILVAGTFAFTTFWMQSRMDDAVSSLAAHMETERMLLAQSVQEALETKVSGEPVFVGQEGNWSEVLTPIKTYRSKSGHWCRQYIRETTFGGLDLSIRGTACRDVNGTWTTVFAEPISDNFSPSSSGI